MIRELPSILDGSARRKAEAQDESKATLAPKVKIIPTSVGQNKGRVSEQ